MIRFDTKELLLYVLQDVFCACCDACFELFFRQLMRGFVFQAFASLQLHMKNARNIVARSTFAFVFSHFYISIGFSSNDVYDSTSSVFFVCLANRSLSCKVKSPLFQKRREQAQSKAYAEFHFRRFKWGQSNSLRNIEDIFFKYTFKNYTKMNYAWEIM